jgi:hypothetical protein
MTDTHKRIPGLLVNFQSRERNGAFGPAARVGDRAVERTEQKVEWSGGFRNSSREPQWGSQVLPVWRRSLSRGSQSRQVLATAPGIIARGKEFRLLFLKVDGAAPINFLRLRHTSPRWFRGKWPRRQKRPRRSG